MYSNSNFTNKSSSNQYNDIIFLFIFILHLIIILTIAITFGSVALTHIGAGTATLSNSGVLDYASPINRRESFSLVLGSGVVISVSIALSMSWIFFLSKFASYFITSLISSIIFLTIIFAAVAISLNFALVGILMLSFALLILISSLFFRPRIDFAAANLRVACTATLSSPTILLSSSMIQLLQGLFTLVWAIAVYGVATNNDETIVQNLQKNLSFNMNQCITYKYSGQLSIDENLSLQCVDVVCQACVCGGKLLTDRACFNAKLYTYGYVCMLFSLLWTCGVCSSVVQCSTASIVSKWWSGNRRLEDPSDSAGEDENGSGNMSWCTGFLSESGLQRSLTTSLGSLCFGSLLVAIVRSIRTMLRLFVRQNKATISDSSSSSSSSASSTNSRTCLGSILAYALKIMEKAMLYFNRYAFCYVGVHGDSFIKASKSVMALFRGKGWLNVLINDDIIDFVITVSNFAIGIVTMMSGYYFSYFMGLTGVNLTLLTTLGFLSGYFTSRTTLSIISAAVSTVYICFAEKPEIFKVRIFFIIISITYPNFMSCIKLSGHTPGALLVVV